MSFLAPLWLLGLALLPLLVWLANRRTPPREVVWPSLLFLTDEDEGPPPESRRRLDWRTWCALLALTAIVLAAAGPTLRRAEPGRRIFVVVAAGPRAEVGETRIREALAPLTGPRDVVRVDVLLPAIGTHVRSSRDAIERALRGAEADVRIVVDDRAREEFLGPGLDDVVFVGSGLKQPANTSFLTARVEVEAANPDPVLHAVVWRQGPRATVGLEGVDEPPLVLEDGEARVLRVPLPTAATSIRLHSAAGHSAAGGVSADAVPEDDTLRIEGRVLRVYVPTSESGLRSVVRDALDALLGRGGFTLVGDPEGADLGIARAPTPASVPARLEVAPAGGEVPFPTPVARTEPSPWTRDLRPDARGLRMTPEVVQPRPGERPLLVARADPAQALLLETREGGLRLTVDPLTGEAPFAASSAWPLLLENLLEASNAPRRRVVGARPLAWATVGQAVDPLPTERIAQAARGRPAEDRPLRPACLLVALAALAGAWWPHRRDLDAGLTTPARIGASSRASA